jgi:hypothetical protein
MDGFSVHTVLTPADWSACSRALAKRIAATTNLRFVLYLFLSVCIGVGAAITAAARRHSFQPLDFFAGVVALYIGLIIRAHLQRRRAAPDADGAALGPRKLEISSEGIRQFSTHSESLTRWTALKDITDTSEHIFLWVDRIAAHIIPIRSLPTELTSEMAIDQIRRFARARGAPAFAESADTKLSESSCRAISAIGRSRRFLPFAGSTETTVVVLGLLTLGLWIGLDRWSQDAPAEFWPNGFVGATWYLLGAAVIAALVCRRSTPPFRFVTGLHIIAVIAPLLIVGLWIAESRAPGNWSWAVLGITGALSVSYAARALKVVTGRWQVRSLALGCLAAFAFAWVSDHIYVSASFWIPRQSDDALARWGDSERLFFEQPARIDAALSELSPAFGASPKAYFVGFAGYGEQRVFAEEIGLASRVIGAKYGTSQRTLLLINDRRDLNTYPLATVSGLQRALDGIGARMDRDRDVLFLVLSSHGSDEPSISVSNSALPLNQLTGEALAAALKHSGIRWKVIIISACHAGAFIPWVKGEDTIVLTAAAADRTSFGCSDDRDLTYFGEALFRDALPKAPSLKEGFDRAVQTIAARELSEHITPSNPQAFFGQEMTERLNALEASSEVPGGTSSNIGLSVR